MKRNHLFKTIAAVSLLTVFACTKDNGTSDDPDQPSGPTTYTLSVSADKGEIAAKALNPAVVEGKNTIIATWTKDDAVTIYKGKTRVGTLTALGSGASTTLSGTVDKTVAAGDVLTLEYLSPAYTAQDGTLTGNPGSIDQVCDYSTATLTVSGIIDGHVTIRESGAAFESQQAIVRFTLLEGDAPGTALDDVNSLVVNAGGKEITVTPTRSTNVLYVALPAFNGGTLSLEATASDWTTHSFTGTGFSFAKGAYYEVDVNMVVRYYYNVTAEKTYATQQALLDETGYDLSSAQALLPSLFPDRTTPVSAINYIYHSLDPQGKPVELSALLYIPVPALEGTKALTGISLTNHGTIASYAECPTMKTQFEGALAWKNYAIVMPDYYGFGASGDCPQAYLDAETTARGNIDAYLAATQLLKDRNVAIPDKLYSFGYSQGGFNSMANLKYVSKHPELGIHFEKVLCGGSPFDVELTWNAYTEGNFRNAIGFVPLTVVSINEAQRLSINYGTLFKGSLLDNWQDWILSKKYTLSKINELLGTDKLSDILHEDLMAGRGDSYNAILNVCRRYSLTSGWTPPSGTKVILFHSAQDDTVPYANLAAMKSFLDSVAPGCYSALEGNYGGHVNAVIYYVLFTINEW